MMNRRTFLGSTAGVAAATLFANKFSWAAGQHKLNQIGLELYTVRDQMKADFDGTLSKVASIGYKQVEFAGLFDRSPKDVRATLDRYGLTSPSCHVQWDTLGDKWPEQIETAKILGQSYIVCPWIPEEVRNQPGSWKLAIDTFNRCGEISKKSGVQFAYHNHWFEFLPVDGKLPYDMLLEGCDPNFVKMEMDLCWITAAGGDPLKYFDKYPGRFPLVHVKDLKTMPHITAGGAQNYGDTVDLTEVGSGLIDWKRIFAQSDKAGIKYYIVEHDHPKAPFDSVKTSYDYLRALRW